jgi:hypothetical protein
MGDYFGVFILNKKKNELWDVLLDQMLTRSRTNTNACA